MPTWGDGHGAGGIVDVVDARQGNQRCPWRGGRGSASPLQGVGGVSPVRHWCGTGWRHRPRPVGVRRCLTLRPGGSVDPRRWSRQCGCRSPCGRSGTMHDRAAGAAGEAAPHPSMMRRCIAGATDTGHRSVSHRPPWPTRAGDGGPALTGTASWMSEHNTPLTSVAIHAFALDTPQPAVPNENRVRRAALTMPLGGLAMKQQDHEPHWEECEHDDARVSVSADRWCGEDERPRAARASDAAL